DLVRALAVAAADVAESRRLGPPAVPVAHHPDVPRDGVRRQCSGEPPLVEPVDQVTKSHAGGLPHHHDDPPETYLTGATLRLTPEATGEVPGSCRARFRVARPGVARPRVARLDGCLNPAT